MLVEYRDVALDGRAVMRFSELLEWRECSSIYVGLPLQPLRRERENKLLFDFIDGIVAPLFDAVMTEFGG